MLKVLRGGQRWLTALFIVGIGGVFVFFLGLQGPLRGSSGGTLVTVGEHRFGTREYERARARRAADFRDRLGEEFDARALSDTIDQLAARELVERALLALEAESLGLSVSKDEIQALVLSDPGFRGEGGRFDLEAFEDFTNYEYGSQNAFIEEQRMALLATKMVRLLQSQPRVSLAEAREAVRRQLESVRIAFVVLGGAAPDPETVGADEVAKALEERAAEIRALYDERSAEFNQGEAVRARHILFALPAEADEAAEQATLGKARETLALLRAGGDFAALAKERSDDVGTKEKGGDLGFFERGQMVPPFEEAAFALEPGSLSEPVRSPFGYHVIRVEEHRAAQHTAFEEVRESLARELLSRDVRERAADEQAEQLAAAVRGGKSLEDAARGMELTLERSGFLTRRPDGFIPGLGAAPEMLATAFALEPGQSAARVFEVGDKRALVQLLERREADATAVEAQVATMRAQLLQEKRAQRADAWLNERRNQLVASGDLVIDLPFAR